MCELRTEGSGAACRYRVCGSRFTVPLHRAEDKNKRVARIDINHGKRPHASILGWHRCVDGLREKEVHDSEEGTL